MNTFLAIIFICSLSGPDCGPNNYTQKITQEFPNSIMCQMQSQQMLASVEALHENEKVRVVCQPNSGG